MSLLEYKGEKIDIYRLPKETEWEWAAGGKQGTVGQKVRDYPWTEEKGEPTSTLANYDSNVGATTPVGRYPEGATPEGLYDMAGNVWEWMENYWDDTEKSARSLRGGSWIYDSVILRCSARNRNNPDNRNNNIGFRVVRPNHARFNVCKNPSRCRYFKEWRTMYGYDIWLFFLRHFSIGKCTNRTDKTGRLSKQLKKQPVFFLVKR